MEGLLLLGGGTEESPSAAGLLLDSQGLLCRPHPAQASLDLPLGLWGAGAVRVDGGVVACGGRTDYGRINNKVRKEREGGREGGRKAVLGHGYKWITLESGRLIRQYLRKL